ncbi:MAG: Ppx/GppA phosphatase family protein [Ghiorsea sp.]
MAGDKRCFAAIDIGSNTFRLMIANLGGNDDPEPWNIVYYTHTIIRLGEGLHHTGELSEAAMARGLAAFHAYAACLKEYHVDTDDVYAVATAAMREADNGELFRQQVADVTGIRIHIVTGEEEAAMSLLGSCAVLDVVTKSDFMLFDIGGASTEFIRAVDGHARDAISRKMGVVRSVELYLHSDPPSSDDYAALVHAAEEHLAAVESFWTDAHPPKILVGTAGTVTTLAATVLDLCPYDADIINNYSMDMSTFEALRDRLLAMPHSARQAVRTIESGRADLIVAGLAIVEAVMRRWSYGEMIIVDAGLLEGAWLRVSNAHEQQNVGL